MRGKGPFATPTGEARDGAAGGLSDSPASGEAEWRLAGGVRPMHPVVIDLIWNVGVPADRRRHVYALMSGAAAHSRREGAAYYRRMLQSSEVPGRLHPVDADQIDVDIY